uniref:Uncharacterized protein n=1 Tax=Oryza punctata TaxID=4537 RepID=A0A0E0JSA2_ORYPU
MVESTGRLGEKIHSCMEVANNGLLVESCSKEALAVMYTFPITLITGTYVGVREREGGDKLEADFMRKSWK